MPQTKDVCIPGSTTPCQVLPPVCTPRQTLVCAVVNNQQVCQCLQVDPPPPRICTSYVVYPADNPTLVQQVGKLEPGCDQAGLEIALAVLLARIMTGPPLP